MLSWAIVSSQLVDECKTLTWVKSCGYAIALPTTDQIVSQLSMQY